MKKLILSVIIAAIIAPSATAAKKQRVAKLSTMQPSSISTTTSGLTTSCRKQSGPILNWDSSSTTVRNYCKTICARMVSR